MSETVNIQELGDLVASKSSFIDAITRGMDTTIVGQKHLVESLLVALLSNGHVLLEGVPGLAKTLAIKTLVATHRRANTAEYSSRPTCFPADLIGTMIYICQDRGASRSSVARMFANFILADEINRAPAKVQSALLEAMQERQVTIGDDHLRPRPSPSSSWPHRTP